jgi:hypothetical protein
VEERITFGKMQKGNWKLEIRKWKFETRNSEEAREVEILLGDAALAAEVARK